MGRLVGAEAERRASMNGCVDRVRRREHTEAQGDEWPFADAGEKVGKRS